LSVPFVWSNHSVNIPSRFPYRLFTFPGKAAIAVSSDSHAFLSHGLRIPEKKIHIIHNGIDLTQYTPLTSEEQDRLRARLGVPPHHRVICQVSRLSPAKGQRDLLRAFADLPDARSTTTLILTGKEEGHFRRELLKLAEDLRISGNVIFAGYCVPREILGIADLFVLPSYVEGFPIACVEAMAMRVPVIRTTTGGWSDMKDCCIGVLPGDIDELRRRMEDVVGNRPTMHAMIERAHTFVSRKCSVTAMCREIEHVYST
jgi:glycosyltransferase involved in cell wall biosynthesis